MRNIVSPLDGFLSPFGRRGGIPLIGGIQPTLFLDFSARVFARRELDAQNLDKTKTASGIVTSSRSTGQTVIDIDGKLKWAMENLYRNGAGGVQAITVVSGVDYTIRAASGSVAYSGAATGTLDASAGVSRVEVTASTTTLTITPTDATEIAVYRSDLGGMQFDKYGSDYLPNTTAGALYGLGIDYSTGRGALQVYEGRTNLVSNFEVTDANWNPASSGVITDQTLNVLGVFRGCLVESGGNLFDGVINTGTFSITSGTDYAVSFVWSDSDSNSIAFRLFEAGIGVSQANVTAAGVFTQVTSVKGTVVLGSHVEILPGLYRTTVIWTPNFTGSGLIAAGPNSTTIGDSILLYCGGIEAGSSASPLIPTYGSSVTRGGDDLSTLISSFGYNVNAGTVVVDFVTPGSDGSDFPRVWQLSTSVDNTTRAALVATTNYVANVVDNAVSQADLVLGAVVPNAQVKVAASFATDDFAASKDGGSAVVDASGNLPATFTQLLYGKAFIADHLNGLIYSLAYYPFAASDAQLVEASS